MRLFFIVKTQKFLVRKSSDAECISFCVSAARLNPKIAFAIEPNQNQRNGYSVFTTIFTDAVFDPFTSGS